MIASDDETRQIKLIQLGPIEVGTGSGRIILDIVPPAGYKLNTMIPLSVGWQMQGNVVSFPADSSDPSAGGATPLELDVTFLEGEGVVTCDLTIFYCKMKDENVCLVERVHLESPLQVKAQGESMARLIYHIQPVTEKLDQMNV